MLFFLLLSYCVVFVSASELRVDPLVLIDQGLVRGLRSSDGTYSSFLGIPYASVDLENPFGPALEHPGFGGDVYNAYYGSVRCPQFTTSVSSSGDEVLDCLRLNIYSPTYASVLNPLPVLVWIHGGEFGTGYGGEYGPENLVKQGIIVVTINYRLGPYGFMCLDIPAVPGNQGLKDQYEALVWVRNNIKSFGGNPYNITIAGQGAGSSSVLLHLYSDKKKVYGKVIAESGTPQNIGTFVEADTYAAIKLAAHLGFNTTSTEDALNFLKQTSHELVTAAAVDLDLKLRPCREKSFSGISNFIETDSNSLSNEKKIRNTPVLIGHTRREVSDLTSIYGSNYYKRDPFYEKIEDNFNLNDDQLIEASNFVRHFYIGDEPVSKALHSELETFDSDIVYNHPIQRTISHLLNENANPIYEYEFSFVDSSAENRDANSNELGYLFKMSTNKIDTNDNNKLITDRVATLWANFIKYGNPTPEVNELLPVMWAPITKNTRPYLVIDLDLDLKSRIYKDRMAFWDLFYVAYGRYNKYLRECI
ncbi:unnamed protein product, partial [Brenthis ino]